MTVKYKWNGEASIFVSFGYHKYAPTILRKRGSPKENGLQFNLHNGVMLGYHW